MEHHALRDDSWQQRIVQARDAASQAGHALMTAAEFAGEGNLLLEFRRKQLYLDAPPSKEFERWMRLNPMEKSEHKPPL
jgi:predicted metallo-beta-lactamase superfamily hydrolase